MAVCAHAQTAIFFLGAKSPSNLRRQIRVASFATLGFAVGNFADFYAIYVFRACFRGPHDARL
jgi:hypothetical protein